MRRLILVFVLSLLGACAELSAKAPLFSAADQVEPPALQEGVWTMRAKDMPALPECGADVAHMPRACWDVEVRRRPDGLWRIRKRERSKDEDLSDTSWAAAIVPLDVKIDVSGARQAFLIEVHDESSESASVSYFVIAPIGATPAREALLLASLDCDTILRDGPIDGLIVEHNATAERPPGEPPATPEEVARAAQQVTGCVATTGAVAREAARRALIAHLDENNSNGARLVFLHP
ncbi:MAG: hypothetical protein ABUL55_00150 [Pseudomonadota bacterium]